ncbi:hypothetical protein KPL71_021593 [Citrus sinensis]|uniref:Uncharacterized protein n=1 Tax=Citrus sinensis TaxID=2711 RepID=A0ACB8JGW5_CITSI|nr:hypothetical protein KPL71_021593 [Citrus sinensis]
MSILFYKLNGFNDPSLKHVFIASLPSELQPDLQRKLTATNLSIADISLRKIFQMAMLWLDKICEQKDFFKDLMEDKKSFSEPHLKMECKDEKKCVCLTKKKNIFKNTSTKKSSSKKPFRYFKKKDVFQYKKKKHNCCFICKKYGHFARNCPHKSAKTIRLIQHLQHSSLLSENEDVESNFSEQSEQDDQTAFIIAESSDSEDILVISTVQNVNHISTIPKPSLKMLILPSKFYKHVPVIGFIDTGADTSMIDHSVLPSGYWEPHSKLFRAVNGETFETTLITKKPIDTLRLYALLETPSPYSHISHKFLEFCPENHSQFHHPSPLWKNEQIFIHLPFKLNEDINPIKASHPAYLMELNNFPPPATNIHHTSIGPSHTLEIIPKAQGCTPGSSLSPQGILVMEQRPDYTNVLFQDSQDPWEDFQSLLHTENPHYTVTNPDSPTASTSQNMSDADEDKYQQAEAYLDERQIRRHKHQYDDNFS